MHGDQGGLRRRSSGQVESKCSEMHRDLRKVEKSRIYRARWIDERDSVLKRQLRVDESLTVHRAVGDADALLVVGRKDEEQAGDGVLDIETGLRTVCEAEVHSVVEARIADEEVDASATRRLRWFVDDELCSVCGVAVDEDVGNTNVIFDDEDQILKVNDGVGEEVICLRRSECEGVRVDDKETKKKKQKSEQLKY